MLLDRVEENEWNESISGRSPRRITSASIWMDSGGGMDQLSEEITANSNLPIIIEENLDWD